MIILMAFVYVRYGAGSSLSLDSNNKPRSLFFLWDLPSFAIEDNVREQLFSSMNLGPPTDFCELVKRWYAIGATNEKVSVFSRVSRVLELRTVMHALERKVVAVLGCMLPFEYPLPSSKKSSSLPPWHRNVPALLMGGVCVCVCVFFDTSPLPCRTELMANVSRKKIPRPFCSIPSNGLERPGMMPG